MASATEAVADVLLREQQSGEAYRDVITTDPVELIGFADRAGVFVEHDGDVYYRDSTEGYALLGAKQLRIIANELDNRNGVQVQSEAADEDGTYSIRGLSRVQLLAITQLVGLSEPDGTGEREDGTSPVLNACIKALGYDNETLDGVLRAQRECDEAFPDFNVEASF